jgi:hypothetical protein
MPRHKRPNSNVLHASTHQGVRPFNRHVTPLHCP